MKLNKKKVAVLVEDLYQELEVWYPVLRLREARVNVATVGTGTKKVYKSKLGYEIKLDTEAKNVDKEVVVHGNLITSRMHEDSSAFMKAIIKPLS